ncbi:hypothetical protein C8Q76DRAFT_277840 [Earliella scabrosa]|nr:hypothetical protein C8Q76DRAFT_277840 [Earliella scabrosa]
MDIYLVRVCQRADNSLFLERKPKATTDDDYIAISHVWGTPETIMPTEVDGAGIVQLSPGKKDILSILSRPDICGFDWFWMDLFCIDQTESASISISDQLMSIPRVYKSSRCVKVLLEHPVCDLWHAKAMEVLMRSNRSDLESLEETFREEELAHSRRCPHLSFFDPWFERLWTRQEGLYVLDVVPLVIVPCRRLENPSSNKVSGWINEGVSLAKRSAAELFLSDKLAYHGLETDQSERRQFELYVDFVYRRHVDMSHYGGEAGPAATYLPLLAAWRSGRITTKKRDYVLAVFPDVRGYVAPPNTRKLSFTELLANALGQDPIKRHCHVVPKVPRGMMTEPKSPRDSMLPWVFDQPNNISEAYDSFTVVLRSDPSDAVEDKLHLVCRQTTLEDTQFSAGDLPRILELCAETMDGPKQMALVSPTGPCVGTSRDVQTDQGLVQQYLVHQFAPIAVSQHLSASQLDLLQLRSTGVVSFDAVKNVAEPVFTKELLRYLVCMTCGTSLSSADLILAHASPRVLSTPFGRILAVVRQESSSKAQDQRPNELQLLCPPRWFMQGFLVASQTGAGATTAVIGRTVVPSATFWEAIERSLQERP